MSTVSYGLYLPNYGQEMSARFVAELAGEAEAAGWDGLFLWDHIHSSSKSAKPAPMVDPWVALAAAAMTTNRLRLGTTVTPVARRRPWKLARETASLDQLSNGRLILSVGLGEPPETEYASFGEPVEARTRAEKLDEGLEILAGLWSGERFSFSGKHYTVKNATFLPPAAQQPRIPVWVGGFWPRRGPFRRAARWDGAFPLATGGMTPAVLGEIRAFIQANRATEAPFDLAVMGTTDAARKAAAMRKVAEYVGQGLTWWLESLFSVRDKPAKLLEKVRAGPTR